MQGERQPAARSRTSSSACAGQREKVVLKRRGLGLTDPSAQTEVPKLLPPESLVVGAQLMARTATGEDDPSR
jgi:hypothetical protein